MKKILQQNPKAKTVNQTFQKQEIKPIEAEQPPVETQPTTFSIQKEAKLSAKELESLNPEVAPKTTLEESQ